ncbi:GNAT family N-acetyltransferase [Pirellulales bacterium]|nr:GNAT family N-acetyltransferase [Pirellulales bacterium]
MRVKIVHADLANPVHGQGVIEVLNSYAADPTGGGAGLRADVRENLIPELRKVAMRVVLLAMDSDRAVGVAVCFLGFSTFAARPLLNIHDLAVLPEYRGKGIGTALLEAAEAAARERGCCKLTLEVFDDNKRARALYESIGYRDYELGESSGARFLSKTILEHGAGS